MWIEKAIFALNNDFGRARQLKCKKAEAVPEEFNFSNHNDVCEFSRLSGNLILINRPRMLMKVWTPLPDGHNSLSKRKTIFEFPHVPRTETVLQSSEFVFLKIAAISVCIQ